MTEHAANPFRDDRRERAFTSQVARFHSACPNCYRDNEPIGNAHLHAHPCTFKCVCGAVWELSAALAKKHGVWLITKRNLARAGE